jgi:hypothetical protein
MSEHLNDEAVEALLSGHERDQPLGALLASIADHYGAIAPSDPRPELATFISTGGADDATAVDLIGVRRRRKRAVAAALTGTVVGKMMIGVSVAAASVVGMQARGMVDVPMLPDTHHRTVVQQPEPTESTEPTPDRPSAPVPTPVVTTLAVAPGDDASNESSAPSAPIVANGAPATPGDAAEHHDLRYRPQALVDSSDESSHDGERSDDDGDHDDDAEHASVDNGSSPEHTGDSDTADDADHGSDHDTPHAGRDHRDDD